MPIKNGFLTSEGWMHFAVAILGGAIATVPHIDQFASTATDVLHAVGAIVALMATMHWGNLRSNLKIAAMVQTAQNDITALVPPAPAPTVPAVPTTPVTVVTPLA